MRAWVLTHQRPTPPHPPQRWVLDRLHIFLHYLRGTLLIDFASSIPIEVLVTATQPGDHSSLGSLRALRVLRLTKLLRILRSNKIMRRIEEHYHIHYSCARTRRRRRGPCRGAAPRLEPRLQCFSAVLCCVGGAPGAPSAR